MECRRHADAGRFQLPRHHGGRRADRWHSQYAVNDPVWVVYITVDDVDQRFNAAIKAGAEEVSAPVDAPGVGRMATIRDPFGASIAFIAYEVPQG